MQIIQTRDVKIVITFQHSLQYSDSELSSSRN